MERLNRWSAPVILLLSMTCGGASAAAQTISAPVPDVTGPIPVTATSVPLMASNKLQNVVDLPKAGYVEEEFFVTGRANIYDWGAGGQATVKTPNAPYTTRIMLRRPSDARRFSGNVIVEIVNAARRYDFPFTWGVSHDHFMESGDAFVLVTLAQSNLEGLKAYDAVRYAPLSLANPTPDETCVVGRGGGAPQTAPGEEGLQYDILAQVGALLKAARAQGPLAGFNVQRLYMTGYDGVLPTYIAAVHSRVRLAGGRPIYDGYVLNRHPALTRLRRCGAAPAANDPRQIIRNLDVPLIRIIGQTDIVATMAQRRDDGDSPGDRYRLYEIAGGAHADAAFYPYIPTLADLKKIGSPMPFLASWPFANQCEPEQTLAKTPINTHATDAAFANLTRWIRDGVAPPRAERIRIDNAGTPQARVALDEFGNAIGGVRSPYLEVPIATYYTSSKGETFCPELGHTVPFEWGRLNSLYGTPQNYAAKVAQSVDRLVRERWLTESDGRKIKAESASGGVAAQQTSYLTIENHFKLPDGRKIGSTPGITIDRDGASVWVFERCGAQNCVGSSVAPILKFDPSGKLVKALGAGMFIRPHGIHIDRDGNVWVTDGEGPDGKDPKRDGKGHQVFKLSQEGKVLMTLGKAGVTGDGPDTFNAPSAVLIAPNGDIFIGDGHGGNTNARVVKFSKDGTFIKAWGKKGTGPGEFETPHALAMDSRGRLFVGDRGNSRIQIFDQDGKFLEEWKQFGRPSGMFIDRNDTLYVADHTSDEKTNPGFRKGITIGSARDGKVMKFILDPNPDGSQEGVAADAKGNIYGSLTGGMALKKYAPLAGGKTSD